MFEVPRVSRGAGTLAIPRTIRSWDRGFGVAKSGSNVLAARGMLLKGSHHWRWARLGRRRTRFRRAAGVDVLTSLLGEKLELLVLLAAKLLSEVRDRVGPRRSRPEMCLPRELLGLVQ